MYQTVAIGNIAIIGVHCELKQYNYTVSTSIHSEHHNYTVSTACTNDSYVYINFFLPTSQLCNNNLMVCLHLACGIIRLGFISHYGVDISVFIASYTENC